MKTPAVFDSAKVHETEAPSLWLATLRGEPEPLLLSRILQRIVVQHATIDCLRYDLAADQLVSIEIVFRCTASRADRLLKQWQLIVNVLEATLRGGQ